MSRHRLRRLAFFLLASLWGAMAGVLGMLGLVRRAGHPFAIDAGAALLLIGIALLAAVGGAVAAQAYRTIRHR